MSSTARVHGWSLRRRLSLTIAVIGVLLLVVVGDSVWLLLQVRHHQDRVTSDYFTALELSEEQYTWMVDAETAVRGYALTHDPASLAPITASRDTAATTARIRVALAGDDEALAGLARAQGAARDWFTRWAQPSIAQVQGGGQVSAADVEAGTEQFDVLRQDFQDYLGAVRAGRDEARDQLTTTTNLLFAAVLVSAVVAGAAVVALWFLLRRWVTVPVADLAREARTVSGGQLDHPVAGSGPRELLALAADVDAMRRRLVQQVTDAEAAAAELRTARARLERSSEELARSNRDLEQFAYVASHDLQEPLRKVASFCQLLEKRYGGQLDDRADQYIGFAVDGAKRMQQLINDLLAFSRVGRTGEQRAPGRPGPTADLSACLDRALVALSTTVEETGAQVTADPLPTVPGEAGLLTQLLQNLVGNAIKFRRPDVVPRVHLGARRTRHEGRDVWELCCADNGIGIEPQYAERVFVIFQRLHAKEVYSGTGIGLALCKRIVEHHGGAIWIDTAAADGTAVHWTLPAGEDDAGAVAAVAAGRSDDGRTG